MIVFNCKRHFAAAAQPYYLSPQCSERLSENSAFEVVLLEGFKRVFL